MFTECHSLLCLVWPPGSRTKPVQSIHYRDVLVMVNALCNPFVQLRFCLEQTLSGVWSRLIPDINTNKYQVTNYSSRKEVVLERCSALMIHSGDRHRKVGILNMFKICTFILSQLLISNCKNISVCESSLMRSILCSGWYNDIIGWVTQHCSVWGVMKLMGSIRLCMHIRIQWNSHMGETGMTSLLSSRSYIEYNTSNHERCCYPCKLRHLRW